MIPKSVKVFLYGDLSTAQRLVNEYSGKGILKFTLKGKWTNKEFVTANEYIGEVYNTADETYVPTKRFAIHYGKNGTHIVPMKER